MKRSNAAIIGILGLILALALINGVSQNVFARFYIDLTEDSLYTLSGGTKSVLQSIDQPITLKYFYSKTDGSKYPSLKLYGARILDLLRQYERAAHGKINLEIYDPRPDTEEEEWADKYGLNSIPGEAGEKLFLGLAAVNSLGDDQTIPVFNFARQEFLEYDVSRLISILSAPKKPVVGVLSSIEVMGTEMSGPGAGADTGWFAFSQLAQAMDVRKIEPEATSIDSAIDVLVVVHPKNLSDQTLFAIDQFVMRGGKLIAMVDPFAEADQPKSDPQDPAAAMRLTHNSSLNKITSKWGAELIEGKVLADLKYAAPVSTSGEEGDTKRFVLWPNLTKEAMNHDDVVTNQLETLVLAWPGALKLTKTEGIESEVVLKSSTESQLIDDGLVKFGGGDPDSLLRSFTSSGEQYPIAVRLHGKLKSNFPDGMPKKEVKAGETPAPEPAKSEELLKESTKSSNVLIVADVDFLANRFSVQIQRLFGAKVAQLLNDNVNFFQNAVENMLGSEDLISIRSRGQFSRPFTRVERMEASAQQHWQQQEMVLQAQLNSANQRLNELQSRVGAEAGGKQVLNKAVLDEIKKFKDQRREAQEHLREVRRNLRQNIENLGEHLFLINTFLVPLLLIAFAISSSFSRKKNSRKKVAV